MMIPFAVAAIPLLMLAACRGEDGGLDIDHTVVVSEDAGRPFGVALSPDGMKLAYAMPVVGQSAIFVANADGSEPVRLTNGVWDDTPYWSPDGHWIAYRAEAPDFDVFVVAAEGGEPRQLTSGPAYDEPTGWLPDGSGVLVYRYGEGDVRTLAVPLDGAAPHPLVPQPGGNQFVTVSPDGSQVAFDVHRGGAGTIWVQGLADGAPRQLTTEGLEDGSPTRNMWSPDGRSVAYTSRRTGTRDIWIADVETGALRQLTSDIRNDGEHTWSPSGTWIAFLSDRGGQDDIWIVPSLGGQPRRVTQDLAIEGYLAWSPDETAVFYNRLESTVGIHAIAVGDGADRVLVEWEGYDAYDPVVSPDGRTVLFVSERSGNLDIWSVPLEGGEPAPFAASPQEDAHPRYSPDGSRVLFQSDRAGSFDVWVQPADGGDPRRLADWASSEVGPRWSPDGRFVSFASNRDASNYDVWVIAAEGGDARRLTVGANITDAAGEPIWAPDGQAIYYIGGSPDGNNDLYRVPLSGGAPQALGASPNIGVGALSPDGEWFAYAVFEEGWGFIEVISTSGGTPRRLTERSERVYQSQAVWSPDGTSLIVTDYDFENYATDLLRVTWPDGEWVRLTQTPDVGEGMVGNSAFTPDGDELLVSVLTVSSQIMAASVADLLAGDSR
jgi:TolB protein